MNRNLRFRNLEDVEKELDKLENSIIETSISLSFYQILNHCTEYLYFSMMGFPGRSWPFLIRKTYGQYKLSQILQEGYIQPDTSLPYVPKEFEDGDVEYAFQKFRKAISDFRSYDGELFPHPNYDKLSKEVWEKVHSMYIANLLGFATVVERLETTPKESPKPIQPKKDVMEEKKASSSKKKTTITKEKESKNKDKIEKLTTSSSTSKKGTQGKSTPTAKKKANTVSKKKVDKEVTKPTSKKKSGTSKKKTPTVAKKTTNTSKKKTVSKKPTSVSKKKTAITSKKKPTNAKKKTTAKKK